MFAKHNDYYSVFLKAKHKYFFKNNFMILK